MSEDSTQFGLALANVGVRRGEQWILREISWKVPSGSLAAILGPNGSGKSTLARVLCGYMWPTVGQVSVEGCRFGETDLNELRHSIRLVQPAGPYDVDPELNAREVVLTGLFGTIGLFDRFTSEDTDRAVHLLEQVGLGRVAEHRYATLSSGERVRALIARALIRRPKLLLLDEPTAGLDLLAREQVLATIHALRIASGDPPTTLLITHHVEELTPQTSQVLLLDTGKIAASGTMSEVLRNEVLSGVYRCPLRVQIEGGRYYVRVDPQGWRDLL